MTSLDMLRETLERAERAESRALEEMNYLQRQLDIAEADHFEAGQRVAELRHKLHEELASPQRSF